MRKIILLPVILAIIILILVGVLVFYKIPQNSQILQTQMEVSVFFSNNNLDPEVSCNKVFEVKRTIPKTEGVARAAIEELLKGPTQEEIKLGYYTNINSGVKLNDISIQKSNPPSALVDFDDRLDFQVGGSCKVGAIRAQITETLKQFPSIEDVIISINGRTEDILQP